MGRGWSSESEPSFQKPRHLPAGAEVNNKMADVRVEELSRFKYLLRIVESYRVYVSTKN